MSFTAPIAVASFTAPIAVAVLITWSAFSALWYGGLGTPLGPGVPLRRAEPSGA